LGASEDRGRFRAIDFETADYYRDSACSVAAIRIENGQVVDKFHTLLRPPRNEFVFTYLHGITWEMTRKAPTFADVWPSLHKLLKGVDFIAAHNASFERAVLQENNIRQMRCRFRIAEVQDGQQPDQQNRTEIRGLLENAVGTASQISGAGHYVRIPAKANTHSEGNANSIPGRRRTVFGA